MVIIVLSELAWNTLEFMAVKEEIFLSHVLVMTFSFETIQEKNIRHKEWENLNCKNQSIQSV